MKQLTHFILRFTTKQLFNKKDIVIHNKQYFYQPENLREVIKNIPQKTQYAGELLGIIVQGQFRPTISLLERINHHTTEKIKLDEKQSWLFTCKRDIFVGKDIEDNTSQNIILVIGADNIVIGLAKKQAVKGKKLYTPLYDIGEFMRREK